ncbi:hypothetical protein BC828DRAFT_406502 [Blastocladiella britannica]|nr:hypothetical protein BC828DRAFT_406502 [Blastocladiella britannica]
MASTGLTLSTLTLRIKRLRQTYFISAAATDTVLAVKKKTAKLVAHDPRDLRLLVPRADSISTTVDYAALANPKDLLVELDDKAVLDQLNVPNDAVLYLSLWISNDSNAADGKWEAIEIPKPAPLQEPEDDLESDAAADAHARS